MINADAAAYYAACDAARAAYEVAREAYAAEQANHDQVCNETKDAYLKAAGEAWAAYYAACDAAKEEGT